ncbi:MAG TPA: hypothetical protein VEM96_13570 [Pyrinomonadaceae bacterium]|nr:hypothetical protein [Pyrinomonadaceae bacterium]
MRLAVKVSVLALVTIACVAGVIAQDSTGATQNAVATQDTRIPRNSNVYIAPMDGFETYLAAALRKKEVPLIIVTDRELADFEITGTHEKKNASWAKTIFVNPSPSASASMQVVNLKTKVVVYADSSHRTSASRGERSTAEKLAKYLKKKIEDDEKSSR